MPAKPQRELFTQSGVNPAGEPFVQLTLDNNVIAQFNPEEARAFARVITEAAEASETDAFIMYFAKNVVGLPEEAAPALLVEFRKWREKQTGKKYGAQDRDDWVMPFDPTKKKQ